VNAGRQVLIAANPKSGAGPSEKLVRLLAETLERRHFTVQIIQAFEQLQSTALELHRLGHLEAVVSAGGDGTIGALANLLPPEIPILIFPLGTENLLAKYWNLTADVEQAATTLVGGKTILMDVGRANGKTFLVMLGVGFDAEVVQQMHRSRTGHITRWSYTLPILRALQKYQFPQLSWTTSSLTQMAVTRHAAWLFVFNVPKYAASLNFCPEADPTDGRLDVCTFKRSGKCAGLSYLYNIYRGTHLALADFEHHQVRSLKLEAPLDRSGNPITVNYQLDGDPGGVLPLTVEVLPARLKLIVPEPTLTTDPIPVIPMAVTSA
jgi:diacylglycerol kinase (ATP)